MHTKQTVHASSNTLFKQQLHEQTILYVDVVVCRHDMF